MTQNQKKKFGKYLYSMDEIRYSATINKYLYLLAKIWNSVAAANPNFLPFKAFERKELPPSTSSALYRPSRGAERALRRKK